jgi:hypothetical protein
MQLFGGSARLLVIGYRLKTPDCSISQAKTKASGSPITTFEDQPLTTGYCHCRLYYTKLGCNVQ